MQREEWPSAVVAHVNRENYQPVKPRVIARQLDISREELADFKGVIKRLAKAGQVAYGANHLIVPVAPSSAGGRESSAGGRSAETGKAGGKQKSDGKKSAELTSAEPKSSEAKSSGAKSPGKHRAAGDYITGTFRQKEGGFGFVRPRGTSPSVGRDDDIFIAAGDALDAATGDTVLVRPRKSDGFVRGGGKRGLRGVIVEVVERETNQFVGTYFEAAGQSFVRVDGGVFAQPILVGDPGAKNAQADDKVVFEMIRFPTQAHGGEGVIVEVLGQRGMPGIDTISIIREYDLPDPFPDDVLEAAREEAAKFDETQLGARLDLRTETVLTIDPVDARDFDDAISLRVLDNGHWLLGVHIADVAHFVRQGSPLDREAYHRATSVYLPDRVLPMLPEIISNGLASLQPNRPRYVKTALIEFTADGAHVATDLHNGLIESQRRFAYEEVDEYLADSGAWVSRLTPEVHGLLGRMHTLAMILRGRRFRRGSLELDLAEVKVDLDRQGRVCGAHRVVNTESHQIIEEFMLAANEAVAQKLAEAGTKFLRRVHASPDPRKLKALTRFVTELGFDVPSLESRFALQDLLADVRGRAEQHAVHYAVLRSLQRAAYSPAEDGHYALASDCYCHFTSPIRRYPDLTIHRLVEALIEGRAPRGDLAELFVVGEHCSDRERRAEDAERELTKIKLLDYFSTRIGTEMDAVITGVEAFGMFAQGVEIPAEGLIHLSSLTDDYYHYDSASHTLAGRRQGNQFRLGDPVRVSVASVDVDRRVLDFRIVQRAARSRRAEAPSPARRDKPISGKPGTDKPTRGKPASGKRTTGKQATGKQAAGRKKSSGKKSSGKKGSGKRSAQGKRGRRSK